ncbi:MAG: Gfo/Idh/MocA family oxidoreductase [Clostridiales bacterium]|nr:Gfo/Idh/MocA family oxidoreductase [Clostridiales bacterium]
MAEAQKVRYGIIGIGNMGSGHLGYFKNGKLPEMELVAVADINPERLEWAKAQLPQLKLFNTSDELIESGLVDAVVIATPHYFHPPIAIKAFEAGLHVLTEKPAGVYTKQVREMNEAAKKSGKAFGIVYNQRTNCVYRAMRELVKSGKYGEIRRVNWIITDWFRTQAYYNSGGWRATWVGEGGGVLLNQCPHNLDLLQWICGMPSKINAVCREGKWHDIEVEDDVMIYAEYPNGASGVFITTTGDCPGTNRLEITLDRAKIVSENGKVTLLELSEGTDNFCRNATEGFARIETEEKEVELDGKNPQHIGILNAFAAHILRGEPLVANGEEGINGLTISNAAFLSSWLGREITLPIDEDLYYSELQKKIAASKGKKEVKASVQSDMNATFGS